MPRPRLTLALRSLHTAAVTLALSTAIAATAAAQTAPQRPMTFLDVQEMRGASGLAISPDGRQALYTISTPSWKEARSQTDIYLVSMQTGVSSTKQLTFTKDKNEGAPRCSAWLSSTMATSCSTCWKLGSTSLR